MTSAQNRSADRNDSSGYPVTATQSQRAGGFATALRTFVSTPWVVSADWFQYFDEPPLGRGDGEDYDMGLVDIHDRPYRRLTHEAESLDREILHAAPPVQRLDARVGIPPAPADPLAKAAPIAAFGDWDREQGFVPPSTRDPIADLYCCWDRKNVYFGLYAMDVVEDSFYRDKKVPMQDRLLLTIRTSTGHLFRIRLGAGNPPFTTSKAVTAVDNSGRDKDIHTIASVRIPCAEFGRDYLAAGQAISFQAQVDTFARAYRMRWSGSFKLGGSS
ncbi:MAG TPA: hypothetical protein VGS41_06065, partial [Chthonomonadales bacterium]|nr:hypothetical protein [Chthonomonadales bacterium]